jgi:hypothetical protein
MQSGACRSAVEERGTSAEPLSIRSTLVSQLGARGNAVMKISTAEKCRVRLEGNLVCSKRKPHILDLQTVDV